MQPSECWCLQPFGYFIPIYVFPYGLEIIGAPVAVVYVVGMFPHIEGHYWPEASAQRVSCIGLGGYHQFSFFVDGEPSPA